MNALSSDTYVTVIDSVLSDRSGRSFPVWFVYYCNQIISVEFAQGLHLPITTQEDFKVQL
jgi:hypothetical protein